MFLLHPQSELWERRPQSPIFDPTHTVKGRIRMTKRATSFMLKQCLDSDRETPGDVQRVRFGGVHIGPHGDERADAGYSLGLQQRMDLRVRSAGILQVRCAQHDVEGRGGESDGTGRAGDSASREQLGVCDGMCS